MRLHGSDPLPLDDGPSAAPGASVIPLVIRVRRTTVPAGSPFGRPAWLIQGEGPSIPDGADACADAPQVHRLEVLGLSSESLWKVHVKSHQRSVFELESLPDRRGHWIMAGDMLRSMNELFGGNGIMVDFAFLPLPLHGLDVQLVVLDADLPPPAARLLAWL